MILLDDNEIEVALLEALRLSWAFRPHPRFEREKYMLRIQTKKILIELQSIYKLPDLKMEYDRMGEFIKELKEEVE